MWLSRIVDFHFRFEFTSLLHKYSNTGFVRPQPPATQKSRFVLFSPPKNTSFSSLPQDRYGRPQSFRQRPRSTSNRRTSLVSLLSVLPNRKRLREGNPSGHYIDQIPE